MKLPNTTPRQFVFIGIVSIIVSILGFSYNIYIFTTDISELNTKIVPDFDMAYFKVAFYAMSAVCIAIFTALTITGIQLIRGKSLWAYALLAIMLFEVAYYVVIGQLLPHPVYGESINSATGIANGGLMVQLFILFPLWAPIMAVWTRINFSNVFPADDIDLTCTQH